MQSTIEKEVKTYLTKIKSFLICDNRLKKSIITEIEASIYEYAETNGIRNIEEIEKHFGTPENVAKTYLSQADPKAIKKALSIKRTVLYAFVTALVMFAVFLVVTFLDAHSEWHGYTVMYPAEEITGDVVIEPF